MPRRLAEDGQQFGEEALASPLRRSPFLGRGSPTPGASASVRFSDQESETCSPHLPNESVNSDDDVGASSVSSPKLRRRQTDSTRASPNQSPALSPKPHRRQSPNHQSSRAKGAKSGAPSPLASGRRSRSSSSDKAALACTASLLLGTDNELTDNELGLALDDELELGELFISPIPSPDPNRRSSYADSDGTSTPQDFDNEWQSGLASEWQSGRRMTRASQRNKACLELVSEEPLTFIGGPCKAAMAAARRSPQLQHKVPSILFERRPEDGVAHFLQLGASPQLRDEYHPTKQRDMPRDTTPPPLSPLW